MAASRPSFHSEPRPRRLGTGGSPGGGERLFRTQIVIAFILGTTILAVLLYLWRRPSAAEHDAHETAPPPSASVAPLPAIVRTKVTPKEAPPPPRVKIGAAQHLKCGASPKLFAGESSLCDSLPFFEQALAKAIDEKVDCAPKAKEEGSINFVMVVDFRTHDVRLYPGRSGSFRGKQAKGTAECVKKALPAPTWDTIVHQYRYYMFAVLATYPPKAPPEGVPNFQ
jgi:hypothetical protein